MAGDGLHYLNDLPLFAELTERECKLVAAGCCRRSLKDESLVQMEGEPSGALGILVCGRARASLFHPDGRELVLQMFSAGDCFGDVGVLGPPVCPYSVIALAGTELLLVALDPIREIAQRNLRFVRALYAASFRQQAALQTRLRLLVFERGEQRIIGYLQTLATRQGAKGERGWVIPVALTHQAIADNCGLTRETVSRALSRLDESGVVRKTPQGWFVAEGAVRRRSIPSDVLEN